MKRKTKRELERENLKLSIRVKELERRICPFDEHEFVRTGSHADRIGRVTYYHFHCKRCGTVRYSIDSKEVYG